LHSGVRDALAEVWRKTYNALGIRMENERMNFSNPN